MHYICMHMYMYMYMHVHVTLHVHVHVYTCTMYTCVRSGVTIICCTTSCAGDVQMEEPVENGINNGVNGVADEYPPENGDVTADHREEKEKQVQPEKVTKKIRVTYEEYRTIANLLILHLRQLEESAEEGIYSSG